MPVQERNRRWIDRRQIDHRQIDHRQHELRDRVDRALQSSGYTALRNVKVTADEGFVHLAGHVSSYHLKQMAQAMAMAVDGVEALQNDLVVC